jgi:hypothetical protein
MKNRSEVTKKKAAATPAAERTEPLPGVRATHTVCDGCRETINLRGLEERNGTVECPSCGMAICLSGATPAAEDFDPAKAEDIKAILASPPSTPPAPSAGYPVMKPKWYCGICGSEWYVVGDSPFVNCGHALADKVDDPRKAKSYGPPAGMQTKSDVEIARRDAADAKVAGLPAGATVSGNRLSIPWGEARCPIDNFNAFKCGGFIASVDLTPGEDRVETAKKILDDLEEIADLAFERQKAWYLKKLSMLAK